MSEAYEFTATPARKPSPLALDVVSRDPFKNVNERSPMISSKMFSLKIDSPLSSHSPTVSELSDASTPYMNALPTPTANPPMSSWGSTEQLTMSRPCSGTRALQVQGALRASAEFLLPDDTRARSSWRHAADDAFSPPTSLPSAEESYGLSSAESLHRLPAFGNQSGDPFSPAGSLVEG
ncbi:hypothetical protein T484DRAFT_1666487, partial [Baffinella frigidus]